MYGTFSNCVNLESVTCDIWKENRTNNYYPENVIEIGSCFDGCTSLKSLVYDTDNNGSHTGTESVGLFEGFKNIHYLEYVFSDCSSLGKDGYTVDDKVFKGCEKVTNISGLFYNCKSLTKVSKNAFDSFSNNQVRLLSSGPREIDVYKSTNTKIYYTTYGIFQYCSKLEECPEIWKWKIFEDMKDLNTGSYFAFTGASNTIKDKINEHWSTKNQYGKIKAFYWTGGLEEIYEQCISEGINVPIYYYE